MYIGGKMTKKFENNNMALKKNGSDLAERKRIRQSTITYSKIIAWIILFCYQYIQYEFEKLHFIRYQYKIIF